MVAYFHKKKGVVLSSEEKKVLFKNETPEWITNFYSFIGLPVYKQKINHNNEFKNL